jgi:hypothetical protein
MAFYDSTRPYTLHFGDRFRQLVIEVPRSAVPHGRVRDATAVALETSGPGRVVTDLVVDAGVPAVPSFVDVEDLEAASAE